MRIALVQLTIDFENKEKNKENCLIFLKEAKEKKADIIFFPEMTLTGFSMNVGKIGEVNGETMQWFTKAAIKYQIAIGFGHVEFFGVKGKNKYTVVSPLGEVLTSYTKIHPFSFSTENQYYEGGDEVYTYHVNNVCISSFICYDLRFPEIFQIASKRAQLITIAANWPETRREHWITLVKARAIENQCFIAAVNAVGLIDGLNYSGDSMIVGPDGRIIKSISHSEKLIISDIDISEVVQLRKNFPLKEDRKEDLYIKKYNY